jgi:hypothetical protein
MPDQLKGVLRSLCEGAKLLRSYKFDCAAQLIEMARLELKMKIHNISEAELAEFCAMLERQAEQKSVCQVIEFFPNLAEASRLKRT